MNTPTYKEQFDKITKAYINDELDPYDGCACFIGNMLNGNSGWEEARMFKHVKDWSSEVVYDDGTSLSCLTKECNNLYNMNDIIRLETNFLNILTNNDSDNDHTEQSLFVAMESTLEMLRKLHEEKGEMTEQQVFTKRQLTT